MTITLLEVDLASPTSMRLPPSPPHPPKKQRHQSSSEETFGKEELGEGGALKIPGLFRKVPATATVPVVSWVRLQQQAKRCFLSQAVWWCQTIWLQLFTYLYVLSVRAVTGPSLGSIGVSLLFAMALN